MLDKLWIRIKGELLVLKDELFSDGEFRDKAESFVDKLERRLDAGESHGSTERSLSDRIRDLTDRIEQDAKELSNRRSPGEQAGRREGEVRPSADEIERSMKDLKEQRERQKSDSSSKSPPPNPRRLG